MTDQPAAPHYLPGEAFAIAEVIRLGEKYGYGNLISVLKNAWAAKLAKSVSQQAADMGAGNICVWCHVDRRTGKKVESE